MLRTLRVRDLAIIEELEVVLEPGLNVITGETGAGKSILMQALDVALGGRPDADLVRTGAEEGVVEALFTEVSPTVRERLAAAGVGAEDGLGELLVRRVIARGGRTRAYVNGALGSLGLLPALATGAENAVYSGEGAAIETIGRALGAVREAIGLDPSLDPIRGLLEAALAELEEAGSELGRYVRELAPDPTRLEAIEERLAQLARLRRKY